MAKHDAEERAAIKSLRGSLLSELPDTSSHPSTLGRRARPYAYAAATPAVIFIVGFVILLAWSFLDPEAGIRMLLRIGMFLEFLVPLLGFFAGFAASGLLILLASKAAVRFRGIKDEDNRGVALIAICALLAGVFGMLLINYSGDGRIEIFGHVLMVLPFVGTIAAFVLVAERRARRPLWRLAGGLPLIVFGLLYLSVLTGSGTRWVTEQLESRIGPVLDRLSQDGLLGDLDHTVRALTAVVCFAGLGIWAILWRPWAPEQDEAREEPRKGLVGTIVAMLLAPFRWLMRVLGLGESETEEVEVPQSYAWLTSVVTEELRDRPWFQPGGAMEVDSDPLRFIGADSGISEADRHEVWGSLFLDAPVSSDQVQALEEFIGVGVTGLERSRRPGVLPDVLMEGADGSGGLETLAAAAVATVLLRGQASMLLVPNDATLTHMQTRIDEILEYNLVDGLVRCGNLRGRKGISNEEATVPQILVARLEDLESAFFDNSLDDGDRRTLLGGFGGIFVAGLMEFEPSERIEIAFVLHKFRILHMSLRSWVQSMVLTAPMPDMPGALDAMAGTLFSKIQSHRGVSLRRRWAPATRVVASVRSDEFPTHFSAAAAEFMRNIDPAWARVVVVLHGIGGEHARLLVEAIRGGLTEEQRTVRIDVVGSAAEFEAIDDLEERPWILVIEDGTPASMRLASSLDLGRLGSRIAWATLTSGRDGRRRMPHAHQFVVPVLGGSTMQGLWIRHAATLIELLEPQAPIERSDWGQFGLPRNGEIPTFDELRAESLEGPEDGRFVGIEAVPGFELRCDRRDRDPDAVRGASSGIDDGNIWSWIARPRSAGAARGLTLDTERDHRLVLLSGGTRIAAVSAAEPIGRIATWHSDAVDIPWRRPFDLARESRFLKWFEGRFFAPETLARDAEKRVRIEARSYPPTHLKEALQHPIWKGGVDLTVHSVVEERHARGFGLKKGRLIEFRAKGRNRLRARPVSWALQGLVSDEGGLLPVELASFEYLGGASALCLDTYDGEKVSEEGLPGGVWSTSDQRSDRIFDPLLSAAVQHALEKRAPGVDRLGRLLVFHLEGRGTVLLIVEPWDSMKTVAGVMSVVLAEDALRRRLCRDIQVALERIGRLKAVDGHSTPVACCLACGIGFEEADQPENGELDDIRGRAVAILEAG